MSSRPPPNPNNPDGRFHEYKELGEVQIGDVASQVMEAVAMEGDDDDSVPDEVGEALEALYAACRSDNPEDIFAINFGKTDNGSVVVAVKTEEQVRRLRDMTNGRVRAVVLCKHCGRVPCLADDHYNTMVAVGAENEEADGITNNQIRFAIYREVTNKIYGHLGAGNRKKLPQCIIREIKDLYPAERGTEYTGFRAA